MIGMPNLYHIFRKTGKFIVYAFLKAIASFWPRDPNSVVIGGWAGELFIDNPKYLLLYLLDHTRLRITWVGNDVVKNKLPDNSRLEFAKKGTVLAFWRLLNAKIWVCCQSISSDLTTLPIMGRAKAIDLWHGIPIKKIGKLSPGFVEYGAKRTVWDKVYRAFASNSPAWLVVSNEKMIDILCDGAPLRYTKSRVLRVGTPRNDFLVNNANNVALITSLRHKYSHILGSESDKKIVLYLPTWRMSGDVFAFYKMPDGIQVEWKRMLDSDNAVLIEKHHWGTYAKYPTLEGAKCSIAIPAGLQSEVDVQELLLISDVLISDYSGAYIDFALLKRPVIHFAYDQEIYRSMDSGLAYELKDVAAGPIVENEQDLRNEVGCALKDPQFAPTEGCYELLEYEKGNASKQITSFITTNLRT